VVGTGVVGTINLYAASPDAFAGRHEDLARIFGAFAGGAVANADLPFRTLEQARSAPDLARDRRHVEYAAVILAARLGTDAVAAEERLRSAAAQAGVSTGELARAIIEGRESGD
jgi:hypothetical protein